MLQANDDNSQKKQLKSDHMDPDQVTRNKIDRHLRDINDQISEEDIKNVNTNITSDNLSHMDENNKDIDTGSVNKKSPSVWDIED